MKLPVSILLLAAGSSTRFGRPKQLIPFQGRSLLRHLAEVCITTHATSVQVVLGAYGDLLKMQLFGLPVKIVHNNKWNEGISSSLRRGIASLDRSVKAALIVLCDQPLVSTKLLNQIVEKYYSKKSVVVASEYANSLGVPALFDRSVFPELLKLSGDRGAKQIILKHPDNVISVPFPEGVVDIDRAQDLIKLKRTSKD